MEAGRPISPDANQIMHFLSAIASMVAGAWTLGAALTSNTLPLLLLVSGIIFAVLLMKPAAGSLAGCGLIGFSALTGAMLRLSFPQLSAGSWILLAALTGAVLWIATAAGRRLAQARAGSAAWRWLLRVYLLGWAVFAVSGAATFTLPAWRQVWGGAGWGLLLMTAAGRMSDPHGGEPQALDVVLLVLNLLICGAVFIGPGGGSWPVGPFGR
jgi:hypothetical protein